jgi:hypothetical protein
VLDNCYGKAALNPNQGRRVVSPMGATAVTHTIVRAVGGRAGPLPHICRTGLGCRRSRPLTFIWLCGAPGVARPINPYRIARLLRPTLGMVASSKS